ncbi:MAG: ATP synthase F0 subunit C [Desulfobacterales bacterium]|jgi:ATP synthase F0 subunit c|nr:ATP synthase F0 subunit C [Desulfobacterales bacterium]
MIQDIHVWERLAQFIGAAAAMGFGAMGAAIGEGYVASEATLAISRTPESTGDIFKTMLVGQAVAESASIFALVVAMLLLFTPAPTGNLTVAFSLLAAGLCMGLGAIGSGVGSGFPGAQACKGIGRQPASMKRLTTTMLVGSAVCQTPAIFALVTSLILLFFNFSTHPFSPTWAAILGASLSMGLGAIGSGIGEGLVAGAGCEGVARNPSEAGPITNIMLLGLAVTETTAIYSLLISFILIFKEFPSTTLLAPSAALLSAGICMGLGAFGPGVGEGFAGHNAVKWIARNEDARGTLVRTMLVGQAVAESTGIYSLVVALVLIFVI